MAGIGEHPLLQDLEQPGAALGLHQLVLDRRQAKGAFRSAHDRP
jgi:hypothetical protein